MGEIMVSLVGTASMIGFLVSVVLFVIALIKKKPKKNFGIAMAVCFIVYFVAMAMSGAMGSSVSKKEYDKIVKELATTKSEFEKYKQDSAGFMKLTEAEKEAALMQAEADKANAAEAKRVADEEAVKKAAEQKAKDDAEAAEAEKVRLEEEAKGYETGIAFNDISRSPDNYTGKKVKFSGRAIQVQEGGMLNVVRMSTDGKYDDVIYGTYLPSILDVRLLEDDEITVYGSVVGLKTYETVMGGSVTLPEIHIDRIEIQ